MISEIAQGFEAAWRRQPTPEELKGLLDARVLEELMFREGVSLGLDQNDPVIRRRVSQKVEVMAEESAVQAAVDDAELERYLQRNMQRYGLPAEVDFVQVFFDPDKHGERMQDDLAKALQRLQAGVKQEQVGDRTQLPAQVEAAPMDLVAREFGEAFADALPGLPQGRWVGPVASGFGLHLVRLDSLTPARAAALGEVRKAVERDWEHERRLQAKQSYYEQLTEKYTVVIEPRAVAEEARP
jgi:5S rRNA maturation endonuclease (ribonuclease M5)